MKKIFLALTLTTSILFSFGQTSIPHSEVGGETPIDTTTTTDWNWSNNNLFVGSGPGYLDVVEKIPKHRVFLSTSIGYSYYNDLSFSGEIGFWGVASRTSFALVADVSRNIVDPYLSGFELFVGIKPYLTIGEIKSQNLSFMVYVSPKYKITNEKYFVLEEGVTANWGVHEDIILSYNFGIQNSKMINWAPGISVSFIYLLK